MWHAELHRDLWNVLAAVGKRPNTLKLSKIDLFFPTKLDMHIDSIIQVGDNAGRLGTGT